MLLSEYTLDFFLKAGWKTRQLPPGLSCDIEVHEPTVLLGAPGHQASEVVGLKCHAINQNAPLAVSNVRVRYARRTGIKNQGFFLYVEKTRVTGCEEAGILGGWNAQRVPGQNVIRDSTVEYCGLQPQELHAVYLQGDFYCRNSIFAHASGAAFTVNNQSDHGMLEHCHLESTAAPYDGITISSQVLLRDCNLVGRIYKLGTNCPDPDPALGNFCVPSIRTDQWVGSAAAWAKFQNPVRRQWIAKAGQKPPYGAWGPPNPVLSEAWFAERFWGGWMYEFHTNPQQAQEKPFRPLLPEMTAKQWEI